MNEGRFLSDQKQTQISPTSSLFSSNIKKSTRQIEFKQIHFVQLNFSQRNPSQNTYIMNAQSLKKMILDLLKEEQSFEFHIIASSFQEWISHQWSQKRANVSNRISKLRYLIPSLVGQNIKKIQVQILKQWRKNQALRQLQFLWNYTLRSKQNMKKINLNNSYQQYRKIITLISWALFKPALQFLQKKSVLSKKYIYSQVAIKIVTNCSQWVKHTAQIVKLSFYKKHQGFSDKLSMQSLGIQGKIFNMKKQGILRRTAQSLQKLILYSRFQEMIFGLQNFRVSLLKQIEEIIKNKSGQVVEKDDIIDSLVYVLVSYKLDNVSIALKFIQFLFGEQIQETLSQYRVASFNSDLISALSYINSFQCSKKINQKFENNNMEISNLI